VPLHCPKCGAGVLEFRYDLEGLDERLEEGLGGELGVWRYSALLPPLRSRISLLEGGTPLHRSTRIDGLSNLFIKDEARNPTSSYADRASTLVVSMAVEAGASRVACATDGDSGASIAAYSSKAALDCIIFAPSRTEAGKLIQALVYGARVIRIPGELPAAVSRCRSLCRRGSRLDVTIESSPYAVEGEKTAAFEIWEELGAAPDFVVVPVGSGTNIYSIWKGFKELRAAGLIDALPHMVAVQADACGPIVRAFKGETELYPADPGTTIATSIAIVRPENGEQALAALSESRGYGYLFSDDEIVESARMVSSREGIFAEPASTATVLAARRLVEEGEADPSDRIVCVMTGSGLKVPDGIAKGLTSRLEESWELVSAKERSVGPIGRTKMEILEILSEQESYPYAIWGALSSRLPRSLSLQSVYQHVSELREMGLVRGFHRPWGSRRSYVALTERGRMLLDRLRSVESDLFG